MGNPIHAVTGVKKQSELDYASPNGLLKFERIYRSNNGRFTSAVSASGFYDYSAPVARLGGCVNERYVRDFGSGQRSSYCFPLMSVAQPDALLWTEDGRLIDFDPLGDQIKPNANVNVQAVKRTDAEGRVQWLLKREDNTLEVYSADAVLLSRTTADGKTVTYERSTASTPASVAPYPRLMISQTDPFGRALRFSYSSAGLMVRMTDPDQQAYLYTHDKTSSGCASELCDRVVRVEYPDGFAREYLYNETPYIAAGQVPNPPLLTGINEVWPAVGGSAAQTVRIGTFGYDADGKANLTQSANGVGRYTTTYPSGSSVQITEPLGTQRTTTFTTLHNTRYITGDAQAAGSGSAASTDVLTYDANGNVESRTDFSGNRSCYLHDPDRNLAIVRVDGLAAAQVCNAVTSSGAALPTGSRKTSTQWHPDWRMASKVAEPGRMTTDVYNGQSDPFNGNAVTTCAPATATLPDGKPIAVLCKKVEQSTTDANGSQGFATTMDPSVPARVWQWTYNPFGQVLTERDPLGSHTTNTYYASTTADYTAGDLQSRTDASGRVTQFPRYNRHGQVLRSVDANGISTDYTYDLRQRLRTVAVAGQTTSYDYDAAGQLTRVTWPDAGFVNYEYDAAHRLIALSDSSGNRIAYTLDNASNRTAETVNDLSGALTRQLARAMDALSRVQQSNGRN